MHPKKLSLLAALDVLLTEGSVAGAATRMNLSSPAMSRILGQIRELVGDPILVRAGRGLVLTSKAEAMRENVHDIVERAHAILKPHGDLDISRLDRIFTLRVTDSFTSSFGHRLALLMMKLAPQVKLRFAPQGNEDVADLRKGKIDLDIGAIANTGPEIKIQTLFRDRFIGVVREGHPLTMGKITPERFVQHKHISASRRGRLHGPVDTALDALKLVRDVAVVVPGFADALLLARYSDFVATVPERLSKPARAKMFEFSLPIQTDLVAISQAWHPRLDNDAAHQWLRACVRQVCSEP